MRFVRVLETGVLEVDEDLVGIVDTAKDSLSLCLLSCTWLVLVEHRAPSVVVAGLYASDDERGHSSPLDVLNKDVIFVAREDDQPGFVPVEPELFELILPRD